MTYRDAGAPKGVRRIGDDPDPPPIFRWTRRPHEPDPELLERGSELLALDQALGEAVDGHGSVVAIEGPPGIGKSSLVSACLELAREREMYTISVRATELERSYPYGIVRQTADSVALDKADEERCGAVHGRRPAGAADPRVRAARRTATAPSSCTSACTGSTG